MRIKSPSSANLLRDMSEGEGKAYNYWQNVETAPGKEGEVVHMDLTFL